jgi:hypothetical protein
VSNCTDLLSASEAFLVVAPIAAGGLADLWDDHPIAVVVAVIVILLFLLILLGGLSGSPSCGRSTSSLADPPSTASPRVQDAPHTCSPSGDGRPRTQKSPSTPGCWTAPTPAAIPRVPAKPASPPTTQFVDRARPSPARSCDEAKGRRERERDGQPRRKGGARHVARGGNRLSRD